MILFAYSTITGACVLFFLLGKSYGKKQILQNIKEVKDMFRK